MTTPTFEILYESVTQRSPKFDGLFFTAVKSTKIFCRPVCPAKTPLSKNVEFFASTKEALHAGYRPCKRCRPLDMGVMPPEWVEGLKERIANNPGQRVNDQEIRQMGLEPVQVRRTFLKRYGMTFHAYQRAVRMGQALGELRRGSDKVDAAMAAGYDSDSGFREAFRKVLGTLPNQAESVDPAWTKWIETPLGPFLAIAVDEGLALLEFVDRRMLETQIRVFSQRFKKRIVAGEHRHLEQIEGELAEYFAGRLKTFQTPIVIAGTPFQDKVWRALLEIPYGATQSYGELAAQIGHSDAQRAVGKANGDNRLTIVVPCHRVIKSDGSLCGYGGGLWRKKWLLELESGTQSLPF